MRKFPTHVIKENKTFRITAKMSMIKTSSVLSRLTNFSSKKKQVSLFVLFMARKMSC